MREKRNIAQRNWAVTAAVWGIFLIAASIEMGSIMGFMTGEGAYLTSHWRLFEEWFTVNRNMTLEIFFVAEAILLLAVIITAHELSHYFAYLIQGTPKKNVHFQWIGINPSISVDIPLRRNIKMISAAAPILTLILPAIIVLGIIGNSPWSGLLFVVAIIAWGISSSDFALILKYLRIPSRAMIEEAEEGELAIWD